MWTRVADGDLEDATRSDLFEYIVDFLCSCSSHDLVWKYANWALQKDPTVGLPSTLTSLPVFYEFMV